MKQFLNKLEDIAWLQTTHLKHFKTSFNSFILEGNEDCPKRIELYKKVNPSINSKPFAIFEINNDLMLTEKQ
jgi:hypothetical protein